MKKCGLTEKELVRVYVSQIRPVAEYATVALHSMLTFEQSAILERQQNKALQFIFGLGISAKKMRALAGIKTLAERRFMACEKFARKSLDNHRFRGWFPERDAGDRARRDNAQYEKYREFPARTDRCYNSPLYYLRRLLNGKATK